MGSNPDGNGGVNRRQLLGTVGAAIGGGSASIGVVSASSSNSDCGIPSRYGSPPEDDRYPTWEKGHSDAASYTYGGGNYEVVSEIRAYLIYWGYDSDNPDGRDEHQFSLGSHIISKSTSTDDSVDDFVKYPTIGKHTIEIDNKNSSTASIRTSGHPADIGAYPAEEPVDRVIDYSSAASALVGAVEIATRSTVLSVATTGYDVYQAVTPENKSDSGNYYQKFEWDYNEGKCETANWCNFTMKCLEGENSASFGVTVSRDWPLPDGGPEVTFLETVDSTPYW